MDTRKAYFAGSWYPGSADACRSQIESFLRNRPPDSEPEVTTPVGGIVPHAGWAYSGSLACGVINLLKAGKTPEIFVLFGMHLPPGGPNYIMAQGAWETPLGNLEIDTNLAESLVARFDFQVETASRYTPDNTIELQLPFIKYFYPAAAIVPIGVPPEPASLEIGRAVAAYARGNDKEIRVLGSTDLTHYGANYGYSPKGSGAEAIRWVKEHNDRSIVTAMTAMRPDDVIREALRNKNACCAGAAAAALAAGETLGAEQAHLVAYANSYDVSPSDSFVGYAGLIF